LDRRRNVGFGRLRRAAGRGRRRGRRSGVDVEDATLDLCSKTGANAGAVVELWPKSGARSLRFRQNIRKGEVAAFNIVGLDGTNNVGEVTPRVHATAKVDGVEHRGSGKSQYQIPAHTKAVTATITVTFPKEGGAIQAAGCKPITCTEEGATKEEPLPEEDEARRNVMLDGCQLSDAEARKLASGDTALLWKYSTAISRCSAIRFSYMCSATSCGEVTLGERPALAWHVRSCQ
jgi:hypothetical protein